MPAIDQWVTGNDDNPAEFLCRVIRIPNDLELIMAVNGALLMLTRDYRWKQSGTVTAEQSAHLMSVMFDEYLNSECENAVTLTQNMIVYTADATYTPSIGLISATIECLGAGGGTGGTGSNVNGNSSGAGGGGYSRSVINAADIGVSQEVIVGVGGAGGASGGNNYGSSGGDSSFGTLVIALGGAGSPSGNDSNSGGAGGGYGTGDFTSPGESGANTYKGQPGNVPGGNSLYGSTGQVFYVGCDGQDAIGYGAGASGARASGVSRSGGNGASGVVIVTELIGS